MVARLPVVLNAGVLQQLQSGDTLSGVGGVNGPTMTTVDAIAAWNNTTGTLQRNSTVTLDHANYDKMLFNAGAARTAVATYASSLWGCDFNYANSWSVTPANAGDVIDLQNWTAGQIGVVLLLGANKPAWNQTINWKGGIAPQCQWTWTATTLFCAGFSYSAPVLYELARCSANDSPAISTVAPAGTNQSGATPLLPNQWNNVFTLISGSGVILPARPCWCNCYIGSSVSFLIYPPVGGTINGSSVNNPLVTPAAACGGQFMSQDGVNYFSCPRAFS